MSDTDENNPETNPVDPLDPPVEAAPQESDIAFALRTLKVTERPHLYLLPDGSLNRDMLAALVKNRGPMLANRLLMQDAAQPGVEFAEHPGEGNKYPVRGERK